MGQITLNELNIGSDVSPDEAQRLVAMLRDHGHVIVYLAGRRGTFHRYRIAKPTWDHCLLEAVLLPSTLTPFGRTDLPARASQGKKPRQTDQHRVLIPIGQRQNRHHQMRR
jgi:hypothetical protein